MLLPQLQELLPDHTAASHIRTATQQDSDLVLHNDGDQEETCRGGKSNTDSEATFIKAQAANNQEENKGAHRDEHGNENGCRAGQN